MSTESVEEIRQRLLRDENVRHMISVRAYEIYERRGGVPGHDVEDWFQAENEILAVLIEQEKRRAVEQAPDQAPTAHSVSATQEEVQPKAEAPATRKTRSRTSAGKQQKATTRRAKSEKATGSRRTKKQTPESPVQTGSEETK
jgi:hypothetical protein